MGEEGRKIFGALGVSGGRKPRLKIPFTGGFDTVVGIQAADKSALTRVESTAVRATSSHSTVSFLAAWLACQ